MPINLKGFGPFDIRGLYPEAVNEDLFYRIGRSLPRLFAMQRVAVGHDIRLSSPGLKAALLRGLLEAGAEITDIGLCGTEMIYFSTVHLGLDGGLMVTASHNPQEYNGLKLVKKGARPISANTGLKELAATVTEGDFAPLSPKGSFRQLDITETYLKHILSYVDTKKIKPYRIVANTGNGTAGPVVSRLKEYLPCEIIPLFFEPDGHFPNGVPNPLRPENRRDTAEAVLKHKADLGVAWDGDFDRCFLFDEKGRFIEGYYMVGFLAEAFLAKEPGAVILHDPRLTWNTKEIVEAMGGRAVECQSGHAFIKDKMRELKALYGGELSAHHYFRDFYCCDSGMIPWLLMLELMSEKEKPLSELMRERQERYPASGEINSQVKDPDAVIAAIESRYGPQGKVSHIDGLSVEMEKWRFNLRKSSTEPEIRLNVETRGDRKLLKDKTEELLGIIRKNINIK